MDVFYEESALAQNAKKGSIFCTIIQLCSIGCYVIGALIALFSIMLIPINALVLPLLFAASYIGGGVLFGMLKKRFNVSYDYCFVSGELRISRVFNTTKRRLLTRFGAENIIQIGDIDCPSFERFKADPNVKTVICTSNDEAAENKFFMYIYAEDNGKKLYVLECREELLVHIMKFAKRTVLDRDYISQEKKKQQA